MAAFRITRRRQSGSAFTVLDSEVLTGEFRVTDGRCRSPLSDSDRVLLPTAEVRGDAGAHYAKKRAPAKQESPAPRRDMPWNSQPAATDPARDNASRTIAREYSSATCIRFAIKRVRPYKEEYFTQGKAVSGPHRAPCPAESCAWMARAYTAPNDHLTIPGA